MQNLSVVPVDTQPELIGSEFSSAFRFPNSLVGSIARVLADDIVAGRLRPGHDLNSVDLARRFDTSRTPVREALLLLEKEGLVEIESHRRPRVKRWTWTEICELYQLRSTLYGLVAELIVKNATEDDLDLLAVHFGAQIEACEKGDVDAFFRAMLAVRDTEARICRNSQLRQVLEQLGLRVLQLRHYNVSTPEAMQQATSDYTRILLAYHERDAGLAGALNRSVVLRALERIRLLGWKETD